MHEFLKKILGTKKPVPQVALALDAVPGWLTEREGNAKATLVTGTRGPMEEIKNGVAGLLVITNNIAGAEHDPSIHPKLRTIAKNSLPQFVRAMKASLAKELPADPEEFYPVAAECVKSCLHTVQGPGRYLLAIFPDEMKVVRGGIDTIGRGINALNPMIGAYRKEMVEVAAARELFSAIMDLGADFSKSAEKEQRCHARIAEMEDRHVAIGRELLAIPQDPRMQDVEAQKTACAALAASRDSVSRTYSALSMTASHVFRKAEKIATRQRHTTETAALNRAMDLLSDHEIPIAATLDAALAAACPLAERMIGAGEVVLKNKEERAIFSDTGEFRRQIGAAAASLRGLEERCRSAETALLSHPLLVKKQSLERERTQLAAMIEKERQALADIGEWREKTEKRLPLLRLELQKKIGEMSGDNVQLSLDDQAPS
jgi:hypothetical protein